MRTEFYIGTTAEQAAQQVRAEVIDQLRAYLQISPSFRQQDTATKAEFLSPDGRVQVYSVQGSEQGCGFHVATSGPLLDDVLATTLTKYHDLQCKRV